MKTGKDEILRLNQKIKEHAEEILSSIEMYRIN